MYVRVRVPGHQEELLLLARLGRSLALVLVLVVIQPVPDHISKVRVHPSYSDKGSRAVKKTVKKGDIVPFGRTPP